MTSVVLKDIRKSFGSLEVIKGIDLTVETGEFCVFVGPSGCGKSTLLRMIAGLEDISSGELTIGGTVMNDVDPSKRGIAMVFQTYALYPHMTVRENMGFALRFAGMAKDEIERRLKKIDTDLGTLKSADSAERATEAENDEVLEEFGQVGVSDDKFLDSGRHQQNFVDADTPRIAGHAAERGIDRHEAEIGVQHRHRLGHAAHHFGRDLALTGIGKPVTATATLAPECTSAPDTISITVSRLTAPCTSSVCGCTPSIACLAS